jgi:hypothetical protein
MSAPEEMDLLGPIARFRFPPDTRDAIEKAVAEAQREHGPRGPEERARARRFIRSLQMTVGLAVEMRRTRTSRAATRADLEPLWEIADALDTIDCAVRKLDRLPGNHAVALDLHVRLACVAQVIPCELADAIADQALLGGFIDLPSTGPEVFGLRWFLRTLRDAVEHGIGEAPDARRGRPEGTSPVTAIVHGIANAYASELDRLPVANGSPSVPFMNVLRAVFGHLYGIGIVGKNGSPVSDKTLAQETREWATAPARRSYLSAPSG